MNIVHIDNYVMCDDQKYIDDHLNLSEDNRSKYNIFNLK